MSAAFEDEGLGLMVRGSLIIPNSALHTKIAVYTPEISQAILSEHPEIVSKWLGRLHKQYVDSKRSCEAENDPAACFNISLYEEFERHYSAWQDGGLVTIALPDGSAISVRNSKSVMQSPGGPSEPGSAVSPELSYTCNRCLAVFKDLDEFERHLKLERNARPTDRAEEKTDASNTARSRKISLNSPWWTTTD